MSMVRGGLFGERAVSSARDHCTRTGWPTVIETSTDASAAA